MNRQIKPIGQFTKRDWQKFIPALIFFGIFMVILGVYLKNWDIVGLGTIFFFVAVISGFVLHFFFGIKIIDLRRDFKNKKF